MTLPSEKPTDASTWQDVYEPKDGTVENLDNDVAVAAVHRRLVRQLDMTLMPMIWILYLFNYLDRSNISQAKLDSFEADLNLGPNDFNLALAILNVGYVLMQIPSNMILARVKPSVYLPIWICTWSCLSAATAGVKNFSGLIAVRFFLGISEAPFFPGVFYLLSCWYTRKELALRFAILYSGLVLATAFSGLLAAGIFAGLGGKAGLAGWQWLFIVEGAASFALGILAFFVLPDFPTSKGKTAFLSEEEKQLAATRIQRDSVSTQDGQGSIMKGLKMAVFDYRTWLFALMLCSNQSSYGFNYFYPVIVQGFGLGSRTITLVCTAPAYLVGAAVSFGIAWHSDRKGERGLHVAIPMCIAVVGFVISIAVLNVSARYVASFLYVSGCFSASAVLYSWAATTLNQTPEKRACATAIINVCGQFGSIWSPYFFDEKDAPRYVQAMVLLTAFAALQVVICIVMKLVLQRANRKILAENEDTGENPDLFIT